MWARIRCAYIPSVSFSEEVGSVFPRPEKPKSWTCRLDPELYNCPMIVADTNIFLATALDVERALRMATDFGIYAYDAYFLECAKSHGGALITLDQQMKRIASQLGLRVLEP